MDASNSSAVSALSGQSPPLQGDRPKNPPHAGKPWLLALTALGVVFGDIGTSPLYTFSVALSATGHVPPTALDVLGLVSLIFWALMAMVSLKYIVFVLRADNDGEGGILALLSLVASDRIANGGRTPILVLIGIMGAALLYGDGVITPAISVLSAIEGLKLVTPAFEPVVLPLTLAILIGLFMIQRHGTGEHRAAVRPGHDHLVRRARLARRSSISGQHPQSCTRSIRSPRQVSWSPIRSWRLRSWAPSSSR